MIILHYNKISEESKRAILDQTLSQEDLKALKSLLDDSYPSYIKAKKKANFFGLTSLFTLLFILLIIVLVMGDRAPIFIVKGSPLAFTIGKIIIGLFIYFLISILIAAYFSMKYLPLIYVKEIRSLMQTHYPNEMKDWGY